ncbi:MAG: pyrroline-5-carboxylate reductase [Thermoanaerobaculales bacterium]|nr:pyrroline-5-carboxylate reductase [Thermoanaerobaculales bacterium]
MELRDERLAFIGCGMMGEAMVKGLLREGLVDPRQIVASHPRTERCAELENRYGITTSDDNAEAANGATFVVLAVKPQFLAEVEADLRGVLAKSATALSVVAGAGMSRIASALGVRRVVRAMPNTPAQIGRGISVWTATATVDEAGRRKVRAILSALGAEEFVTHEAELDMATALSGTGPAYVFLFMEALVDAGVHMGFSRRVAERLVFETVLGAAEFAKGAPEHLAKLRNQVTSPGGTSAAAQYELERGRLRTVLSDAVWAAYRRCQQLGGIAAAEINGGPQK